MFQLRYLVLALIAFAAVPAVSQAQISVPFVKKTYCVQVKYEMWRNGATYWSTVFETDDADDANLMYALLQDALEDGDICELLNCGFDWIIRDVRLVTKYEYFLPELNYRESYLQNATPLYQYKLK